jgi:hypothetical protein
MVPMRCQCQGVHPEDQGVPCDAGCCCVCGLYSSSCVLGNCYMVMAAVLCAAGVTDRPPQPSPPTSAVVRLARDAPVWRTLLSLLCTSVPCSLLLCYAAACWNLHSVRLGALDTESAASLTLGVHFPLNVVLYVLRAVLADWHVVIPLLKDTAQQPCARHSGVCALCVVH